MGISLHSKRRNIEIPNIQPKTEILEDNISKRELVELVLVITMPVVWVQSRSEKEDAFPVAFTEGMYFADLSTRIIWERAGRLLPARTVESIYEDRHRLKATAKVPCPVDGGIGSPDKPYYFSVVLPQSGNIFLFEFHVSSCW